jgi:hypothetical protein
MSNKAIIAKIRPQELVYTKDTLRAQRIALALQLQTDYNSKNKTEKEENSGEEITTTSLTVICETDSSKSDITPQMEQEITKTSQTVKRTRQKRVAMILSEIKDIFDVSQPLHKKSRVKLTTTLPSRAITDSVDILQSIRSQHTEKNDIEDAINAISSLISNDINDDEYHDDNEDQDRDDDEDQDDDEEQDQDDDEEQDQDDVEDQDKNKDQNQNQNQDEDETNPIVAINEEHIINYYKLYDVAISSNCIKNILKLYQTFINMNNNKIIKLEIDNIDNKVSVFGFNTIKVLKLEVWLNEMICLGKQIVKKITEDNEIIKDDKFLNRMRFIMTYTGFKAAHYNNKNRSEKYSNLQSKKYIFIDKKMQKNAYNAGKIIKKSISNNNIISFDFYKHSPSNTDLSEEYIKDFYKSIYNMNIETYNIEKILKVYKFLCNMEKLKIVELKVDEDNINISVFGFSILIILSLDEFYEKINLFSGNIIKLKSKDVNKITSFRSILAITGLKLKRKDNKQRYIYSLNNMNRSGYRAYSRKEYRSLK